MTTIFGSSGNRTPEVINSQSNRQSVSLFSVDSVKTRFDVLELRSEIFNKGFKPIALILVGVVFLSKLIRRVALRSQLIESRILDANLLDKIIIEKIAHPSVDVLARIPQISGYIGSLISASLQGRENRKIGVNEFHFCRGCISILIIPLVWWP